MIDRRLGGPIANAVDRLRPAEIRNQAVINPAVDANTVGPGELLRGMFKKTRKFAVVGEQQKTFGVDIEPPDGNHSRQIFWKIREDGRPVFRIAGGRNQSGGLVIQPEPSPFGRDRAAVNRNLIVRSNQDRRMRHDRAVQDDAAGCDQTLGVAARRDPSPRQKLRQSLPFHNIIILAERTRSPTQSP